MTVTCDIVLHDRDKMTSRYIDRHKDGTITVWPTWTGNEGVSLRLNASPEQLAELRDLINSALRHHENVRAASVVVPADIELLERSKQTAVLSRPDRFDPV